jgi:oxygen-dependent protoporphyrinogen oxidase
MDVRLYGVRGGTGALAAVIARGFERMGGEIRLSSRVESVDVHDDGVELRTQDGAHRFDAVVLAVPAAEALRLTAFGPELREWLAGVRVSPALTMAMLLDRPVRTGWFGLSVPRIEKPGSSLVVVCEESNKNASLVPAGRALLVAFPAPSATERMLASDPRSVADELMAAVDTIMPGTSASVTAAKLFRQPEGYTQFGPGSVRHLLRFEEAWLPPRLALAGDYRVAPTVEGAVVSGSRAARRVLDLLQERDRGGTAGS